MPRLRMTTEEREGWASKQAKIDRDFKNLDIAPDDGEPHIGVVAAEQGNVLLAEIEAFLGGFIVYPSDHARVAHVLWVAHTHMMYLWESTPRIAFLSVEPASGKSRALEVSELLVPRPMEAVNMSPSALFRSVGSEDGLPTILHDEIDTVFGPKAKENEEIRGLLNAGHRRGAKTYRTVMHGKVPTVEAIEAFSAVALAGLGWLPDTILSRSIVVRMRKRKQGENIKPFRRRVYEKQGHAFRDRLSYWAQDVKVNRWPEMPAGIEDRAADVWEALLAVADAAGGDWPKKAREAATALVKAAREVEPSPGNRLLVDLKEIFGDVKEMPTEAILTALHNLKESPWNDLKGRALDHRGLALRLRQYEVKPTVLAGGAQRGYRRADFHDAWERYIPPLPVPTGSVTCVTSVTGDEKVVADDVGVTDVTFVTHVGAGEMGFVCAQCGAGPSTEPAGDRPIIKVMNGDRGAWVHDGHCLRFWKQAHPQ